MKNKDVEDIVVKALDEYTSKHETWNTEIYSITKEAFAAHRTKGFDEVTIKRLNTYLETKDKEILEHKQAISNLRGYIGYLESQIYQLEKRLDEHENSY
jgi:hypothetical protein